MSSGINPVRVFGGRKHQSRFLPPSTLHLRRNNSACGIGIGTMRQSSPVVVAAASVGASKVGHFENTLPSKGYIYICYSISSSII